MNDTGIEYLTNLAVRCPLPNSLPQGEGSRLLKIRGRVGLGIRWQVNLRMLGLDSPIPSPCGRGLGRGQANRRLASSTKDTVLSAQ
ncbi:Uncharacterised protein [Neisseria lactamica]|nr:hypothetical protein DR91_1625 [Neisseria lactamica ATCC 23970]VTQ49452.1 Uncharacterised protein [Neisseria lactamica]